MPPRSGNTLELVGLDCPGVEARRCLPDGGARVCPPVQASEWAVRVHRHGLARRAEMELLRG